MRRIMFPIVAVVLILPALATAQQAPATLPTLPATVPTLRASSPRWQQTQPQQTQAQSVTPQAIQAVQKHIADLHALQLQARNAMLGALTPAHRALLSQIAGGLAVAPNPDAAGAARELDATLTPGEGRAVVTAEQNLRTQMFAEMQTMMPPPMRPHALSSVSTSSSFAGAEDAGAILLRNAAMGMMPMPNMMFGPGPQLRR